MLREVVVQGVGERLHQTLQPLWARRVLLLACFGVDKKFHPQVLVDLGRALRLREPSHRVDVVRLHTIEIVLGLSVNHAEDHIGVGLPVNVRDAPIVPDNGDVPRLLLPAHGFLVFVCLRSERGRCGRNNENKKKLLHECPSRRQRNYAATTNSLRGALWRTRSLV